MTGTALCRRSAEIGLPAAFVGHPEGTPDLPYAAIDNVEAARRITSRLRGTGRQRVGMIVSALDRDSGQDRLAGFRATMGERFDPRMVIEFPLYTYARRPGGDAATTPPRSRLGRCLRGLGCNSPASAFTSKYPR